jgi:hypothetical protein
VGLTCPGVCAGFQVTDCEVDLLSWVAVWIGMCMIYDMIYLLTAIGLTPDGSTHLHTNNTQNNIKKQNTQNRTYITIRIRKQNKRIRDVTIRIQNITIRIQNIIYKIKQKNTERTTIYTMIQYRTRRI